MRPARSKMMVFLTRKRLAATLLTASLTFIASLAVPLPAQAASLKIGLAADVSSLDPHYLNIAPNIAFASHLFEALVNVDASGQLIPGLALSWRALDDTTWEFKLRRGVKFHNGDELSVQDVIFSLDRPARLVNSPGSFLSYTKQIVGKQAPDADTLRLTTRTPYGALPLDMSTIFIVSKRAVEQASAHPSTDDFNSGKALIGTGPFKFASFKRSDRIEIVRNDQYWGEKAAWDKVTFRIMSNSAARTAALLAGDVDAIESVPSADLARLKASPKFTLAQKISWRTIFWHLDHANRPSPYISDKAGQPLTVNPLRDVRVRRAISMSINRPALAERTMEGLAVPAANLVAPGILGYSNGLKVEAYDPAGAKKLLAQAGYPDGFKMTIHGPSNRYLNDELVIQTMAQFLNRIGIQASVETMPPALYFSKAKSGTFSFSMLGWGSLAGDFALRTLLGSINPETGWGSWNWGQYSNPALDRLIQTSLASVDEARRRDLAQQAAALALGDYAAIPLHHQYATWAMRKGITYTARTDEFTLAHQFRPAAAK